MKARIESVLLIVVAVAVAVSNSAARGQPADAPRKAVIPLGVRLVDVLKPNDTVVEVERNMAPPLSVVPNATPTLEQRLQFAVDATTISADVTFLKKESFLVEDETWLATRVTADIKEKFHERRRHSRRDVTFEVDGGELVLRGVRVRTADAPRLEIGKRYLVFLRDDPQTRSFRLWRRYEILGDSTLAFNGQPWTSPEHPRGMHIDRAATEIRRWWKLSK